MRRGIVMGWMGLTLAFGLACPGEAATARRQAVPQDSFLEYRADTVEALALQAEKNPRVRARYARHFGIPANRVAQFIRENLVISYLPRAGTYRVYNVTPGGRIYSQQRTLARGTRVLTLRNGEPVLRWICGNAMVPRLPQVAGVREVPPAPAPAPVVSVPAEQVALVPRAVSVPFETVTVVPAPAPVPAPVTPVPTPVTVAAAPVVTPVPVVTPPTVPEVRPSILPVMAVGPGIISAITPERPPVPPITELPPPEVPIPEPGSMAMLAMGSLPMAWGILRSRRRGKD